MSDFLDLEGVKPDPAGRAAPPGLEPASKHTPMMAQYPRMTLKGSWMLDFSNKSCAKSPLDPQ